MLTTEDGYDTIGLQSPFLDDIFRYKYKYLDMVRAGVNLAVGPKEVYKVPFSMNSRQYELTYRIGHDNRLGLLEDIDRKGELRYRFKLLTYRSAMYFGGFVPIRNVYAVLFRGAI